MHDGARHVYDAARRVSVVAVATARCFQIYRHVLGADFGGDAAGRHAALAEAHLAAARVALRALEENGGIYIKLGQHVSALTYLLPPQWTETMTPLQDRCPRLSLAEIELMFRQDMGVPLAEYFSDFDPQPVGVASLAQVHIATLRATGERVAVKVQHPLLARFVPLDVYMTRTVFGLMNRVFPEYPMAWLADELQNSIYVELDFTNEAANAQRTAAQFAPLRRRTALRVPAVVSAEKRVLVMEYVAGARLDDLAYMEKHGIRTRDVLACLSHVFNSMIFSPGFGLHCDPHLGNLAIRAADPRSSTTGRNFEIVLYDHGLYRYIPLQMQRDYAHFWLAILDNDVPRMKHYVEKFSGVLGDQKFRIFASAITGRDPDSVLNYDISKARDDKELLNIQTQLNTPEVLEDLMAILASMPRMVLLILKTNDLTRNLDETLNHPLGPERTFLILANYCASVVYREAVDAVGRASAAYSWARMKGTVAAWLAYRKRLCSLYFLDAAVFVRNIVRA
ncbi:ABC1-domain-containing protein [Metschnikowia bicuspidata var. bicuspidata NRRL YB-4993]|uniref:ABC1-domain-containing protein n=1 Tax=Metschnikowia bicuspidata var. bicuspidata NRRL YB-4993 TaxID=869754 RepID=A0A1A0HG21_9ASCO|nr:ABC1-domain-containing protein [Metschnikowia bicuspidata var. bicuspidata NRRL YB-4993]OBA22803.1 ABC1-domain-containing protein [Metschnikowia bicuspidata var. bicuspidata NRRL YB-4993]